MKKFFRIIILIAATLFCISIGFTQTVVTYNYTGAAQTWTVPAGVSTATVYCWGGGGGGGGASSGGFSYWANGGGGGGGACSKNIITVNSGDVYNITVGAGGTGGTSGGTGGTTTVSGNAGSFWAAGGAGGSVSSGAGGTHAGGAGGSTGTGTLYSGGSGSAGNDGVCCYANGIAGTGGGGAGSGGNGTTPSSACGVTGNGGAGTYPGGDGGVTPNCNSTTNNAGVAGNVPGGGGSAYLDWSLYSASGASGGNGRAVIAYAPPYQAQFISMNTGSSTWCAGETRNVTVTIKNIGTATWTNSSPDVNIGVKWNTNGANWADYYVRVDANGLAPGSTATFTLPLTASNNAGAGYTTPLSAGTNNIIFDVVKEGDCWFGNNNGSCGPGNATYVSAAQTITCCTPSAPTAVTGVATGQTTANLSWAAGATAGSPTVTYYWYVGTNSSGNCASGGTQTYNYTGGAQTWTVPSGVSTATVLCFGGGGGGAGCSGLFFSYYANGGGGGGGSCSKNIISVSSGQAYNITVGAGGTGGSTGGAGGTTTVSGPAGTFTAGGGSGGTASNGASGGSSAGGAGGSTGTGTVYSGGSGSAGYNGTSSVDGVAGTGGGGGGSGGNGSTPAMTCAGTGTGGTGTYPGGNGGSSNSSCGSPTNIAGVAGNVPGGGGSGYYNWSLSTCSGANGGNGQVIIIYSGAVASGSTTGLTATATGLNCGTTYYLSVNASTSCDGSSSACATSAAFTTSSAGGNPNTYGTNSWIGYVYTWAGSPGTPLTTSNYVGYITENQIFDRNVGSGSVSGLTTNLCSTPADNFSVRYRMNTIFPGGNYIFTVGADDGVRLSVDGGNTWLINQWQDQGYTTFSSACTFLQGTTNLVLEYYENSGGSEISFSYKPSPPAPTSITANPVNAMACPGNSTTLTANGSLALYYPFNNTLNDASGNGINLSGSGGTLSASGLQLSSAASYSTIPNGILNTDQYTLDFYMQFTAAPTGQWGRIFGYAPTGTDRSPGIWKYPGAMQLYWRHDPGDVGTDTKVYTQGQWYHVVGEKNGTTFTLWVDGAQINQFTVPNPKSSGSAPIFFGAASGFVGGDVLLKEFKIYSGIFRWYTVSCGGTAAGSGPSIVASPTTTTTYYLRTEGGCNSSCVSATINMDNTAPSHDAVSVSPSCWICNNSNTYTITATSTEAGVGYGGSYGIMALINYQGENAGQYGGYFSWHPTGYVWTLDQVAATGGGYASKYAGYGNGTITLVSCSTAVSGNTRTVYFVVKPNTTFPVLLDNDVSMYTSDACNNQAGWTNWQTNFSSVLVMASPGAITGTAAQCPNTTGQVYSITAVTNATSYTWTVPTGWTITSGQGTNAITVTTGSAGQNGNITVTASNACSTTSASSLAVTVTAPSVPVAGSDQYICTGQVCATMAASGTGTWTQISGPNTPTIQNTTSPTTVIGYSSGVCPGGSGGTQLISGTYVFRWSAGACSAGAYDDVVIVHQ